MKCREVFSVILSSKGKFFNKVNIIDIFIILLVIIAIVGAYFRFNGNNIVAENKSCVFQYTITVRGIRENNMKLLMESVDSQTPFVLDSKINSSMGKLVDVKVTNAVTEIEKSDGTIVSTEVPAKYDVILTLEVNGYQNESGYFTPENFEICAGKEYSISNINCLVEGVVNEVRVK